MVKVYGNSDAEREFLRYLDSHMLEIRLKSLDDYQDFDRYPQKRKTDTTIIFDSEIESLKSEQTRLYNRNGSIWSDLKRINDQISYKERGIIKLWGELREKVKQELTSLKTEKNELESESESNKRKMTVLKSHIQDLYSRKKTTLFNIDRDIQKVGYLNSDSYFKNVRQGAFGERNVIAHIKELFKNDNNYHLINAFDINLLGKAINIDNHTLTETKLDHILLCPFGLFIFETKAWKNYSSESITKVISQLQKIRKSFREMFNEKINQDFVKIFLVCTERHIPLTNVEYFKSIRLEDLQKELNNDKEILSNDKITLILNTFLPHLKPDQISTTGKLTIKLKTMFVKTKRFIKDKVGMDKE